MTHDNLTHMVETRLASLPLFGAWNLIALQDAILQFLKFCQLAFYRNRYAKCRLDTEAFHSSKINYENYPEIPEYGSILVFKPDEIGDAIYAMPALQALRTRFPKATLCLICQEKTKPLFERTGLLNQIVGVAVKTRWLRYQTFDLEQALDGFSQDRFDAAVFLRTYPAYYRQFKRVPAHFHIMPHDPRLKSKSPFKAFVTQHTHQSRQMFEIAFRMAPGMGEGTYPEFQWKPQDRAVISKVFQATAPVPYIVIHPFARFETRRYPLEYWTELIKEIQGRFPFQVVVVGGKEDPPLHIPGVIETQGKLSLAETGYLLSQSTAFLGNESGPGHLASVLKVPTTMIFGGHSHLSEWGPIGNHLVLKKPVPCENCYLRACPRYKVKCLTQMKPHSIKDQLFSFLEANYAR